MLEEVKKILDRLGYKTHFSGIGLSTGLYVEGSEYSARIWATYKGFDVLQTIEVNVMNGLATTSYQRATVTFPWKIWARGDMRGGRVMTVMLEAIKKVSEDIG